MLSVPGSQRVAFSSLLFVGSSLGCGVLMLVVVWARASYVTIHASVRGFFSSRGLWNVCWLLVQTLAMVHGYACGVSWVPVAALISAPLEVVGRSLALI